MQADCSVITSSDIMYWQMRFDWMRKNAAVLNVRDPGTNPMIVSYNSTSSLVRFQNKNIFFCP
jgi:hypothetical protein